MRIVIPEEIISIGAGLYVGFKDGQGIPINSATRYSLLAAPTVLRGAIHISMIYGRNRFAKFIKGQLEKMVDESANEQIRNMDTFPNRPLILNPKEIARGMGKTALETGAGYIAGYGLAKIIAN